MMLYKQSVLPTLGGTLAAFMGWVLMNALLTGQVNWLSAILFTSIFGLVCGVLICKREIREERTEKA